MRQGLKHTVFAVLLLGALMFAGEAAAQQPRTIQMPLIYLDTAQGQLVGATYSIYGPWIKRFQNGEVLTRYNQDSKEDYGQVLGSVTVINTNDSVVVVSITPAQNARAVQLYDVIQLSVPDTVFHPAHVTSHIIALSLQLHNHLDEPFIDLFSLGRRYLKDPAGTEAWLLDTIYRDLQAFNQSYRQSMTSELFTTPFAAGRYKGKTLAGMFGTIQKEDLYPFLWFMISFPGKYIGIPYKINETYASWLVNNSPIGGYEVLAWYDRLNKDSTAFARTLSGIPGFLQEADLAYNAAISANSNNYWGRQYSDNQYTGVIWYSRLASDKHGEGLVYLYRAEDYQNEERWNEALHYCRLGVHMYNRPPYDDRLLDLYFKQSYIYYTTSRFDSSFMMLQQVQQILRKKDLKITDYTYNGALGKYHNYMAYTYYKQGRYAQADSHIDSSQLLLADAADNKTITSLAYNFNLKGDIYKNQALYEKASEAYQKSADLYKRTGDLKTTAVVKIDLAIIMFKQGRYRESNELLFKLVPLFEMDNDLDNHGLALSQAGQNYWNLGLYDSAIDAHSRAIGLRRQAGNRSGQAFSWEQLGTLYQKAGLKTNALLALDSAAFLYESLGSSTELAEVLTETGKVYKNDKETEKAETYYRKAANTLAQLGNRGSYANALFELGLLLLESKPDMAYTLMDSCRMLSLDAGKQADAAYAMMNMGNLMKAKGNYKSGKEWYEKARVLVTAINEPHALAHYYKSLGNDAVAELNLDSANRCYQKAIDIYNNTDKALALQLRTYMAGNHQSMGNYAEAEKVMEAVLSEARGAGLLLELAEAFRTRAWMLLEQGSLDQGQAFIDSAARYYKESGNSNSLAYISDLRGEFYRKLFNFSESYKWYALSDSIYAKSSNPWLRSSRMFNFIVLYFYQGDFRKSLQYTQKALELRPFLLQDQTWIDLQVAMGEIYYHMGMRDSARWYMDTYLPLARNKKLTTTLNLISLIKGRILTDEKKFAEAISFLKLPASPAAGILSKNVHQQALAYLGMAYSGTGQKDSAARYFDKAAQFAAKFELPSFSWEALYLAGLDAYTRGDYAASVTLFKQAVAMVNRQAANLYGGDEAGKLFRQQPAKADLYTKLMSALTRTGQNEEAWQYATLAQAAAVSDLAGGLSAEMGNEEKQQALKEAQAKFEAVKSVSAALQDSRKDSVARAGQIAVLEAKRAIAETDYLNYIKTLNDRFPELRDFFANQSDPKEFRNLHSYLNEDMAMLMYVINNQELMIFWATQENTGIVAGTIPPQFYTMVEQWITALKNPLRPAGAGPLVLRTKIGKITEPVQPAIDVKTGAGMLYKLLIEPVLPYVGEKKSWCIIPNGKLTHIPFHAIGTENAAGTFEYLAATRSIFYTNKPGQMFLPWNRRNKQNFAIFGNPDKSLENAGIEAKEISGMYAASKMYLEDSATVESAKQSLSGMHYVHFATHGVLRYPDFDSSYLVFAPSPAQPEGGRLSLWDIRQLSIKGCDLVTLSACETAVTYSDGKSGWYISPANAFLINRVRSVIASLWEVDDKSTGLLMERFYKHLQTMPKSEALRTAMADVSARPEYTHPFYWAGFVLYGDWQ